MMRTHILRVLTVILTVGTITALDFSESVAQNNDPAEKRAALSACLAVGDYVRIVMRDHGRVVGKVRSVGTDVVEVYGEDGSEEPTVEEILIVQRRGNKAGSGALVGGVVFGILGLIAGGMATTIQHEGASDGEEESAETALIVVTGGLIGAAVGAGIGALIGSTKANWKRVCRD